MCSHCESKKINSAGFSQFSVVDSSQRLDQKNGKENETASMTNADLAIVTISWARNEEEEKRLRDSLEQLSTFSLPVFITDGGSSSLFCDFLQSLPRFTV